MAKSKKKAAVSTSKAFIAEFSAGGVVREVFNAHA